MGQYQFPETWGKPSEELYWCKNFHEVTACLKSEDRQPREDMSPAQGPKGRHLKEESHDHERHLVLASRSVLLLGTLLPACSSAHAHSWYPWHDNTKGRLTCRSLASLTQPCNCYVNARGKAHILMETSSAKSIDLSETYILVLHYF